MIILGVDPGLEGGLAFRMPDGIVLEAMPTFEGLIDLYGLGQVIEPFDGRIVRAYLEMQSLRPMQQGQFKIGRNFGLIEAILHSFNIETIVVRPQEWSKPFMHEITEKDAAKRYTLIKKSRGRHAARLYPGVSFLATAKSKVPHSGLVDAALIAQYGWDKERGDEWLRKQANPKAK